MIHELDKQRSDTNFWGGGRKIIERHQSHLLQYDNKQFMLLSTNHPWTPSIIISNQLPIEISAKFTLQCLNMAPSHDSI